MSRVTIKDIYWELSSDEMTRNFAWDGCKDIEIAPRKIIEKIIERCQEEIDAYTLEDVCCSNSDHHYANGKLDMAYQVRDYAKRLLAEFEEDDKQINVPNCIGEEDKLPFE